MKLCKQTLKKENIPIKMELTLFVYVIALSKQALVGVKAPISTNKENILFLCAILEIENK